MSLTVLIFDWNASGMNFCPSGQRSPDCTEANFFKGIENVISNAKPSICVFVTENEAREKTYLHSGSIFNSGYIPNALTKLGYKNALKDYRLKQDSTSNTALRMSVYAVSSLRVQIIDSTKLYKDDQVVSVSLSLDVTNGLNKYNLCFIAIDIPHKDAPVIIKKPLTELFLADLIMKVPVQNRNTFIIGDYASNIQQYDSDLSKLKEQDNIKVILGELQGFAEGINGQGPNFPPTWKLRVDDVRLEKCTGNKSVLDKDCYVDGKLGWHNRTFYKANNGDVLTCSAYTNYDLGNISKSDHSAVVGFYKIRKERNMSSLSTV